MALASPETADRQFADVICADPEWVRREFDALVAAAFGEPPTSPPPAPPRRPPDRDAQYPIPDFDVGDHPKPTVRRPRSVDGARQRAPPA